MPFAPSFSAGTTPPQRRRVQPVHADVLASGPRTGPLGLERDVAAGVAGQDRRRPAVREAQANAGTCGSESQIGTTSVLAGSGEDPLDVSGGRVYLTTGYKGDPFGLSIVVPADAGPFNLGKVVVRAAIHIDPNTAQVTVLSDPLPQSGRHAVPAADGQT